MPSPPPSAEEPWTTSVATPATIRQTSSRPTSRGRPSEWPLAEPGSDTGHGRGRDRVTEIATPPRPSRLSNASTPATPAASATPTVPTPTWAKDAIRPRATSTVGKSPSRSRNSTEANAAAVASPAKDQGGCASSNEAPPTGHDADAGGDERYQVGAHGHRADDQDRVVDDHPIAGDDARDEHEPEVAAHDPRLYAGSSTSAHISTDAVVTSAPAGWIQSRRARPISPMGCRAFAATPGPPLPPARRPRP